MSSSISNPAQNGQPARGLWPALAPYVTPSLAAAAAIVPVFRDMIAKTALQKGEPLPKITLLHGLMEGLKAAPTVGVIVGTQMLLQKGLEESMSRGESSHPNLSTMFFSSALVGSLSSPILAVFNGQTMGKTIGESLRNLSTKQCLAIAVQETAFVGGLSAADRLARAMKNVFGDNKVVDYSSAFAAGAAGSLAGHPANTALTRWQAGMNFHVEQSLWGSAKKARAVGCFSVVYKLGKEKLSTTVENPK